MFTPICKFLYIIYIFSKCESLNVTTYCDVQPGYKWDYFVHIYPNKIDSEFSGFPVFSISSEFITMVLTARYFRGGLPNLIHQFI